MADLPLRRYSNTASDAVLTATVTAAATTWTLNTVNGFPSVPFTLECETEVVLVTNKSGTTLTVTRGYDDSIAASHVASSVVKHVLTADDFDHRWQDVLVTRNYNTLDDEFDDGEIDSDWVEVNPTGSVTWTESNGVLSALVSGQSSADCAALIKPTSSLAVGDSITVAARAFSLDNYIMFGPVFASGFTTTDDIAWQMPFIAGDTADAFNLSLRSGTFANVSTTHYSTAGIATPVGGWLYMRLAWVTLSAYRAWYSIDGVSWTDLGQGSFTIAAATPPAYMGVGVSAWGGSGDKLVTFDYFRVVNL